MYFMHYIAQYSTGCIHLHL